MIYDEKALLGLLLLLLFSNQQQICNLGWKNVLQTYIASIMTNREVRTRQFWFGKTLMVFKSLVQLLRECFMIRPRKHTAEDNSSKC